MPKWKSMYDAEVTTVLGMLNALNPSIQMLNMPVFAFVPNQEIRRLLSLKQP